MFWSGPPPGPTSPVRAVSAGNVFDYFTINGKSFPETQPIRVKEGDVIRLRLFGAGSRSHSIHIHGHVFQITFKDGHPLPASTPTPSWSFRAGATTSSWLR